MATLKQLAKAVIAARKEVDRLYFSTCGCSSFVIQRGGCQCGRCANLVEAEAKLKAAVANLRDMP